MILICAFCIVLIQTSSAHVISYVPRNTQGIQRPAQNLNSFTPLANNRAVISRPLQYANYNAINPLNTQLTNAELENARIANAQNAEITSAQYSNARLVNTELANAKFANEQIANAELANSNLAMARFQPSWANRNIANANVEINNANVANSNAGFWANNLSNLNGNMATFSLGDGPHAFTVTSGSPNSPPFGIQLMADALEVGGTVSINGQYPIFGTVAVNGNLPTDGSASVNYSCGRPVNA